MDDNYLGEAQVNGEVIGRTVSFIKRYLVTSPVPVKYTGIVSENEDYMQGEWNIGLQYSGLWSARRGGENLIVDLQTRLEQKTSLAIT